MKYIRKFKLILLEHAYAIETLKKFDNFFNRLENVTETSKEIKLVIQNLHDEIKLLSKFNILSNKSLKKDENIDYYICQYSTIAVGLINKLNDIFNEKIEDDIKKKYSEIIFPEDHNKDVDDLYMYIEIEKNNFNRIHISDSPVILRYLNLGKILYKTMIQKLNYISSEATSDYERTIDAELVWKSISLSEKNIYFFICGEKIIAFSKKNNYDDIIRILQKYFKYELKNNVKIPLDDNFRENFNIQNKLLNDISEFDVEIKKVN
jgi:hypothetical protein